MIILLCLHLITGPYKCIIGTRLSLARRVTRLSLDGAGDFLFCSCSPVNFLSFVFSSCSQYISFFPSIFKSRLFFAFFFCRNITFIFFLSVFFLGFCSCGFQSLHVS